MPRPVRFGPYEFDRDAQVLTKHGHRLKLQGKPLQLLAALLENSGQTVSRDELQRRLWADGTFVDLDTGLNTVAKRLRTALSDSADQPVYIETLTRTGYRFIAPVQTVEAAEATVAPIPPREVPRVTNWWWTAAVAAFLGAIATASFLTARAPHLRPATSFRQLTFGRGTVFGAAFGPDGRSVVYSAKWDAARPRQIYLNNGVSPESRALGLAGYSLEAVSPQGELALSRSGGTLPIAGGELFKVPLSGGVPVAVEKGLMSADWSPDGRELAIVRAASGRNTLEYPAGRVLHSTAGWLSHVRVSPDGQKLAVIDHPVRHDNAGTVRVVDLAGRTIAATRPWASVLGLAWRSNEEFWFSATDSDAPASLWSADLAGEARPLAQFPGSIRLRDVSLQGLALVSREHRRLESIAAQPISSLDWTRAVEIDNRGRVLFDESGEAVANRSVAFLASGDGVARLGEGIAMGFGPDGKAALLLDYADRTMLRLMPLEGGRAFNLPRTGLTYQWARYFPDGRRLLALASEPGKDQAVQLWTIDLPGGERRALTEPGMVRHAAISPRDGGVAYLAADGRLMLNARPLGYSEPLAPIQWSPDGRFLYVQHLTRSEPPARVSRLDVSNGELRPWREFSPPDTAGVDSVTRILLSPDCARQVFTVRRVLSELYLASGLR